MKTVYNFSAGPAMLPREVLQKCQDELLDWQGLGMSVMEVSHRGPDFMSVAEASEAQLRSLLAIPDNYKVLFIQGGATLQFAAVPLNLSASDQVVDYALSGHWAKKAVKEAQQFSQVNLVTDGSESNFTQVQDPESWNLSEDAAYLHVTTNETIHGVELFDLPDTDTPIVADMSSNILSKPVDVSRYGVIYAGAQKNIGPAGLTIVIVRDDLLDQARATTPTLLKYRTQADAASMSNTPPTFAWYFAGLVFDWVAQQGGLTAQQKRTESKANLLYEAIDGSSFYQNPVAKKNRSLTNIPFTLADDSLNQKFLDQAKENGLCNLKGHRAVGGMRASIYNAMPEEGVKQLVSFMRDFESKV